MCSKSAFIRPQTAAPTGSAIGIATSNGPLQVDPLTREDREQGH
jgi:hypothetical protein